MIHQGKVSSEEIMKVMCQTFLILDLDVFS
uniref:Uncharacterized protein n=1 Tax=Arundo donax TaxID=35708 RepID=A0A0A9B7Q8_ARUDO